MKNVEKLLEIFSLGSNLKIGSIEQMEIERTGANRRRLLMHIASKEGEQSWAHDHFEQYSYDESCHSCHVTFNKCHAGNGSVKFDD